MKRVLALCLALVMVTSVAAAAGLFPTAEELFGTFMPSIGVALDKTADSSTEADGGTQEVYSGFTLDDYAAFGSYLKAAGAKLDSTETTDSAITADLTVRGASMQFIYDWKTQTATAVYPAGTRPEKEKATAKSAASLLPPVGGIMPSAQFAVNREPDSEETDENGITQTWNEFTDKDYSAFSTYLAKTGAELQESNTEAGILTAKIGLNANSFTFTYDWHTQTASVLYPVGTSPEREEWNSLTGEGSILPEMATIGKELPSMSQGILREPDATETLDDGSRKETYNHFEEADYTAFSQYLQTTGCTVDDYHVEDGNVMVIQLSNITGSFTFTYDPLRHVGTVVYPKTSRIEKAWVAPTATPRPKTATATAKPSQGSSYSSTSKEDACWSAARTYFNNLRWNNPSSVKIYDHTTIYNWSSDSYTFMIDYSAENGFGGTVRKYYYITVDATTKKVTLAFDGT